MRRSKYKTSTVKDLLLGDLRGIVIDMMRCSPMLGRRPAEFFFTLTQVPAKRRNYDTGVVENMSETIGDLDAASVMWIHVTLAEVEKNLKADGCGGHLLCQIMLWQFKNLMSSYIAEVFGHEHIMKITGRYDYLRDIAPYDKNRMTQELKGTDVLFRVPDDLSLCTVKTDRSADSMIELKPGEVYPARLMRCPFSQSSSWRTNGWPSSFHTVPEFKSDTIHFIDDQVVMAESLIPHDRCGASFVVRDFDVFDIEKEMGDKYYTQRVFLPLDWIVAFTPRDDDGRFSDAVVLDDVWWDQRLSSIVG